MYKYCCSLVWVLLISLPVLAYTGPNAVDIHFGKSGLITYDLKTGKMSVYEDNAVAFSNVYAEAKIGDELISSKNYPVKTYVEKPVSTGFGKGKKYTIKLTGTGMPEMDLVFYTYPNREYFLTETAIKGLNLTSNYIAPFCGNFAAVGGDARTLFVPFDNDTFISYDAKPFTGDMQNISSEVGTVYDNTSRAGFVVGSVEHTIWTTGVLSEAKKANANTVKVFGGYTASEVTRDRITHGAINGNTLKSPLIFVGCFKDWREGFEEYGKANRIAEPPYVFNWTKPTPVGWNSWGVIQEKLTYDKAEKVADFFADSLAGFRTGNTAFIDLDSYWDNMVKGGDYSQLKAFADHCIAKGLQPGVYWAPFVDWGFAGGGDRKAEGGDYKFGDMWTKVLGGYHDIDGARALDPTHPGTQQRIAYTIKKLKDCGFKMIKIDFLGHATAESTHFYDTTVTTGMQAYRKGMEFLIDQLGSQMLIYAAISPNLAAGRYVHTRRVACDAFKSIHDTKYTLNSVTYGWWQTYVYNYIDADQLVLDRQPVGENRARVLSGIITGTFITGDDFSEHGPWSEHAKEWFQNKELLKIVENGKAFMPVEGNTGTSASNMFSRKIGNTLYLAVFNYDTNLQSFVIDAKRIGLSQDHLYNGSELLQGGQVSLTNSTKINVPGADARLFKFKIQ